MTPDSFAAWRKRMASLQGGKFSQADAARELGKTTDMIKKYEKRPHQLGAGAPYPIPRAVALACAAIEAGLQPAD